MHTFPFGRRVTSRPPTRNQGGLFVLGAYPSALHVRWQGPDGTRIAALAVDDEPTPFWTGDDQDNRVEAWKRAVGFRAEWGSVEPAGQTNGSSGRWVDERILKPLGFDREHAWITDCLDTYRASKAQAAAIADRFMPFADRVGLERPDLPEHPSESAIVGESKQRHLDRLADELHDAQAATIVTLGNAALRVMRALLPGADAVELLSSRAYGRRLCFEFEGRSVAWYALVHPGGRGAVREAHAVWTELRSDPGDVAARGVCPACRGRGLVPILWGMPAAGPWEDERRGRLVIGGCVVSGDDPDRHCIECGSDVYADGHFDVAKW